MQSFVELHLDIPIYGRDGNISISKMKDFVKLQCTFRDMEIQSLLKWVNLGDICPFLFRDMGYFSNDLKGYGVPGTPFQGLVNLPGHVHKKHIC